MLKQLAVLLAIGIATSAAASAQPAIQAISLKSAFEANNLRAESQYSGKTYIVIGAFEDAETGLFGKGVVVTLAGSGDDFLPAFSASLAAGEDQKAISLDKGNIVRLRCTLKGTTMGVPAGRDCRFE